VNWDDMALVGRIARAHGNRGQVIVNPETDFAEKRFRLGSEVFVERDGTVVPLTITGVRFHRARPILGLAGVETMNDAEALAGLELRVPASWLEPLPAGTWFQHELVGCRVETTRGEAVGLVERVEGGAGGSRLVVGGARGEVLVPLAGEICVVVDVAGRRIVVDPPDGLLDLNVVNGAI
jgi:16S rRNA processing protein RimM